MNNIRRSEIRRILKKLSIFGSNDMLSAEEAKQVLGCRGDIEDVLYEEQDAFDSMPEGLQSSYRGEISEESIDYLEESIEGLDAIEELLDQTEYDAEKAETELENIIDSLESIDGV